MVRWLSQRPWSRAPKHDESVRLDDMMKPAPQTPHFVRPENRYCGRFATPMAPAVCDRMPRVSADAPSRPSTSRRCMIRSAGTSSGHPLGCRIQPRHALSGVRVLHVPKPVPDQAADVQLVVQDAGSAFRVAVDRARTPRATERAWDAFAVQALGDLLRRYAGDEVAEDAPNDRSLGRLRFPARRRRRFRRSVALTTR